MQSEDSYGDLVLRLYDAAVDQTLWPALLKDIADHFGAFGAKFLLWEDTNGLSFSAYTGWGADAEALYRTHYGAIDPRRRVAEAGPVGELCVCHEQFDEDFVRRSEFYNEFLLPMCGRYIVGAKLASESKTSAFIAVHRNTRQGCFEPEDARRVKRLVPHAMRAADLSLRYLQLRAHAQTLEGAMDRVPWGMFVTDAAGKVLLANHQAEAHLMAGDGLATSHGKLGAWQPRDSERLRALIARTADGALSDAVGGAAVIERSSGLRPLNVLAAPLSDRTGAGGLGFQQPMVILFVSDPERETPPSETVLRNLYRLTSAEARLVLSLAQGLTVEQVAREQEKSLNTARSQLKSAMAKMGINRQAELVRAILGLTRPSMMEPAAARSGRESNFPGHAIRS